MFIIIRKLYTICGLKTVQEKELLIYHFGCYSNLVTIATKYVADANHPKKASYQNMTSIGLKTKKCVFIMLWLP